VTDTIRSHQYPNGLTLAAESMDWLESASVAFYVPAGCVYDPADRGGLASFTCEMALRGAGPYSSREFIETLEMLGAEHHELVGKSHVLFGASTIADNLHDVIAVLAEVVRRPHLPKRELEASRLGAIQELRAVEDEPSQKLMLELRRCHYPWAWGRPSIGDEPSAINTTLDDIKKFHTANYRPNGMIVGVAGRFDWDRLVEDIGSHLGDWQPKDEPTVEPGPRGPQRLHLDMESAQTQIGIGYASVPVRHPDYLPAWAGMAVLSDGASARLFTEVREKRGLCYSIGAGYHSLLDQAAVFCHAGTTADRAQETLDVTLEELDKLKHGVNPDELDRLKARVKSALVMQQESSSGRASSIARDWVHLGRIRSLEEIQTLVDGLTLERLNGYLADNPPQDFTIAAMGPQELETSE